jgi:hypothetical protein
MRDEQGDWSSVEEARPEHRGVRVLASALEMLLEQAHGSRRCGREVAVVACGCGTKGGLDPRLRKQTALGFIATGHAVLEVVREWVSHSRTMARS